jgi:F-type H+-transporting ATPase subunit a
MEAGQILTKTLKIPGTGISFTVNPETIIMTWIVILFFFMLMLILRRRLKIIPDRGQVFLETLLSWFDSILRESLGADARKFLPFAVSIFLFVLISNWLNLIPGLTSPTKDLNTCLGLGLLVFIVAHASSVKKKGFKKYIKSYFEPFWFLFPSNIFGEASKVLSHSFRLFGNIFAGGIVLSVIPVVLLEILPEWIGVPVGLVLMPSFVMGFFGFFLAGVQAFVFAMLAIAYISVLR